MVDSSTFVLELKNVRYSSCEVKEYTNSETLFRYERPSIPAGQSTKGVLQLLKCKQSYVKCKKWYMYGML